jgi:glutamate racemase
VLKEIAARLPGYDFLYLGDNARSPYGTRSFETVYEYTMQCVELLFEKGCNLVVLACNTASAKALRSIQQNDLPVTAPEKRVLGVIRPTTEIIGRFSESRHVGILGTKGTVDSGSYIVEIERFFPDLHVYQEACPMWVPLIENNEIDNPGADYFIKKHVDHLMQQQSEIDAIILACTHYPLIEDRIRSFLPASVKIISQGKIVADSLASYLERHPEIDGQCSKGGSLRFYTTGNASDFDAAASFFYGGPVKSSHQPL